MKIEFKRKLLLDKISLVLGITEPNSPNEILRNILLRSSKKRKQTCVAATDHESTVFSLFETDEIPPADFDILIPGHRFFDIVRRMDDENVSINIHKNNQLEVNTPVSRFKFPCLSGNNFPAIASPSSDSGFTVAASEMSAVLPSVQAFSSDDNVRRNINGVYFEPCEGKLRLVATDSHRLAYFQKNVGNFKEFSPVILPRKAVGEISKVLRSGDAEEGGNAKFSFEDGRAFFSFSGTTVVSTPIDSDFPKYTSVLPDIKSPNPVVVDRESFLRAVQRVSVFCRDVKKLDVVASAKGLSLESGETESGEAAETVPFVSKFGGEDVSSSFNPDFIVDSLNLLDGNEVEFRIGDGKTPAVLTLSGSEDFVCVLMPVVS